MKTFSTIIFNELSETIKRPKRLLNVFDRRRLFWYPNTIFLRWKYGENWTSLKKDGFEKRDYKTYKDYIKHQKLKLQRMHLSDYDTRYRIVLRTRLEKLNILQPGMSVLCLGARLGTEVKSFLDLGCFATGIDINPGEKNKFVVFGDFHDIQFPESSCDLVFTNSIDHVYSIEKVIGEIKRILKPTGLLILQADLGSIEERSRFLFESFRWTKVDDLVSFFEKSNFKLFNRSIHDFPRPCEQLCFNFSKKKS